jgi:hypothetical protein
VSSRPERRARERSARRAGNSLSSPPQGRREFPHLRSSTFILRSPVPFVLRDAAFGGPQDEGDRASRRTCCSACGMTPEEAMSHSQCKLLTVESRTQRSAEMAARLREKKRPVRAREAQTDRPLPQIAASGRASRRDFVGGGRPPRVRPKQSRPGKSYCAPQRAPSAANAAATGAPAGVSCQQLGRRRINLAGSMPRLRMRLV